MSLIGKPFYIKDGSAPLVIRVGNIKSTSGYDCDKRGVYIDNYIAQFVSDLNGNGIATIFCCSGIKSEHKKKICPSGAYLVFVEKNNAYKEQFERYVEWIKNNIENVTVNPFIGYTQICLNGLDFDATDDITKDKWDRMHNKLLELTKMNYE